MSRTSRIKTAVTVSFWSLAVLNASLAVSLLGRWTGGNQAVAQEAPDVNGQQAAPRRPGDYLIVPGRVQGLTVGLIHVLDSANGELTALAYDENTNALQSMPKINIQIMIDEAVRQQQANQANQNNKNNNNRRGR